MRQAYRATYSTNLKWIIFTQSQRQDRLEDVNQVQGYPVDSSEKVLWAVAL